MTIYRMTASFGKLQNETLELHDGLNILTMPNESGKTTWSAFLLAMFYGIDTAERAKAGYLPAKTKYKPWSGAPMQGSVELDWNGRRIVLERTSRGKTPMGQFRAYEKESGAPVEGLTGENCGQVLLGVPRSVFERSAFVRQLGLAVGADDALEKRLSALVTSGEEDVSAAETARRLRERKNRIRHNKTGLLPDACRRLEDISARLEQLRSSTAQQQALRARQRALREQQEELREIQAGLTVLENRKKLQQKYDAKAAMIDAANRLAGAQAHTGKLPARAVLADLQSRIRTVEAMEIPPEPPAPPSAPDCPEALRGVPEAQLMEKAARDGREFDRLTAIRRRPAIRGMLTLAFFAAAAVLCGVFLKNLPLCAVCAALALGGGILFLFDRRHNRQYDAQLAEADALLTLYGRHSRDEFSACAADYRAALLRWQQETEQLSREAAQRQRLLDEQARQTAQLIGSAAMLRPDVQSLDDAARAAAEALAAWDGLAAAQTAAAQTKMQYDAVCAALDGVEEQPLPARDLSGWTPVSVRAELTHTEMELASVQSRIDQTQGSRAALGDPAALAAEQEALTARIRELEMQYDAAGLAEAALQEAAAEMQRRFAPALTEETGRLFAALTDGKYDRMLLDRQMEVMAGESGEAVLRPGGYLSAGTQDALYLALRLAICRLALPADTPVVLDDALVCFDDARLKNALAVLRQEAQARQILLFSCQSREGAG